MFDLGAKIDILGFCNLLVIHFLTFLSKIGSLQHVSDKVLRAKGPHGTYGNIMVSSKSGLFDWIFYYNFEFYPPRSLLRFSV